MKPPTTTRTCVAIIFAALASFESAEALVPINELDRSDKDKHGTGSVLLLASTQPVAETTDANTGLLARELIRQALLIAGRDAFNLATRDESLRESFGSSNAPRNPPMQIKTSVIWQHAVQARVDRRGADTPEIAESIELSTDGQPPKNLIDLCSSAERASRNEFVELLTRAGFGDPPPRRSSTAAIPDAIENYLQKMTFLDQFVALRDLHALIKEKGESPALVGGLVRGYSNLGELTAFLFDSKHKVFRARALLYAERLVAARPGSPFALYHRAYARALAGLHAGALADLAAAGKIQPATLADVKPEGAWTQVIEPYCHLQFDQLLALADGNRDLKELARLLAILCIEDSDCMTFLAGLTQRLIEIQPACFRAYDTFIWNGALGTSGDAATNSPQNFLRQLEARVPVLLNKEPAASRTGAPGVFGRNRTGASGFQVEMDSDRIELWQPATNARFQAQIAQLRDAGNVAVDRREPSLAVLAQLADDTLFTQAVRYCEFVAFMLGNSSREILSAPADALSKHPDHAFIAAFRYMAAEQSGSINPALKDYRMREPGARIFTLLRHLNRTHAAVAKLDFAKQLFDDASRDGDLTAIDLLAQLATDRGEVAKRLQLTRSLVAASPQSPIAFGTLLWYDWPNARAHTDEWDQRFGFHPYFTQVLGEMYFRNHDFDAARPLLEKRAKVSPEPFVFEWLAGTYLEKGDVETWRRTLLRCLDAPSAGLEHARINDALAKGLCDRYRFDEALPYAKAAADTGAAWALLTLSDCYEYVGDWKNAERAIASVARNYADSGLLWYQWCMRTRHGDPENAWPVAERVALDRAAGGRAVDFALAGWYYVLARQNETAAKYFRRSFELSPSPTHGAYVVLDADARKDVELRDKILDDIIEKGPAYRVWGQPEPLGVALARCFKSFYSAREPRKPNFYALERIYSAADQQGALKVGYPIAKFLDQAGYPEQACNYYRRVWFAAEDQRIPAFLARDELARKKILVPDCRPRLGLLVRSLIEDGQNETALTELKPAVDADAPWALELAAYAHEGLGEWDQAEKYMRLCSERSVNDKLRWLGWCVRTDRGDAKAARELYEKFMREDPVEGVPRSTVFDSNYYLLTDRPAQALDCMIKRLHEAKDPVGALQAAILADALHDFEKRDWALEAATQDRSTTDSELWPHADLAILIQGCLKSKTKVDPKALDSIVRHSSPLQRVPVSYFAGCFLETNGAPELAQVYLREAAMSPAVIKWTCGLARKKLRDAGVKLPDVKPGQF